MNQKKILKSFAKSAAYKMYTYEHFTVKLSKKYKNVET